MSAALLVPCYNATCFLPRFKEQVKRLHPSFDEVLLADDASQDDTAAMAESAGFQVLRLPRNIGPGGARNALARASTAEWIHFHDVDDEIAPDYLQRVRSAAVDGTHAVFHFTDFIDEVTRQLLIRWELDPAQLAADAAEHLLLRPMPTMSSFLRREKFLSLGGFDETHRCFEDGDFHFRLACSSARLVLLAEVLEWSLRHGRGAGANQLNCFQCRLAFLEHYEATAPIRLHRAIAAEAERAAVNLLRFEDRAGAQRAIALARRLGRIVPETRNPLLRALRTALPAATVLRWQDRWRSGKQKTSSP